jgi:hypothetical protein
MDTYGRGYGNVKGLYHQDTKRTNDTWRMEVVRRSVRAAPSASSVPSALGDLGALAVRLAAIGALAAAGCISRELRIETEPPGAEVRLNGTPVGTTPADVPFRHYGVYQVEITKEGHETLRAKELILAPAYARFPLCLFTELLWPGRIRDQRVLSYELTPPLMPDREELIEKASRASDGLGGL